MSTDPQIKGPARGASPERRSAERRQQVLRALLVGNFRPRRRAPRRESERALGMLDWHHPQWLAAATLIVVFSGCDALLTLVLLERGAYEINPLMKHFIAAGSALAFAVVKVGLTAAGVVMLTLLARVRAFGSLPVGVLLYLVLLGYGVLILYEYSMVERL